jgi:hypothetical protein
VSGPTALYYENDTVSVTNNGTWTGSPTSYSYQWKRNASTNIGTNSSSYTLSRADLGNSVTCVVTATNAAGSASATSNSITNIRGFPAAPTGVSATPTGSTRAEVAFDVLATSGNSNVTEYSVLSSGGQTATGTSSPITVTGLTKATAYTFDVRAINGVGTGPASTSNSITTYLFPENTVAPVVTGLALVGQTLSVNIGTWVGIPTPTITYLWKRNATSTTPQAITTATSSSYTLTGADLGDAISCQVMATNAAGIRTALSNAITNIQDFPAAPRNVIASLIDNFSISVAFIPPVSDGNSTITQYRVIGETGEYAEGTSSPITVTGLNPNTSYRFAMRCVNGVGQGAQSSYSNRITTTNLPAEYKITPSATSVNEGDEITFIATAKNVRNPETTLYWIVSGIPNANFTGTIGGTLNMTGGDGTGKVTVKADNKTEGPMTFAIDLKTSSSGDLLASTGPINIIDTSLEPPPGNTVLPAITVPASIKVRGTLSVSNGTWTNSPTTYYYAWRRNGTAIGTGNGASSYTLVAADVSANITCQVTASNTGGGTSAVSNSVGPVVADVPAAPAAPTITGIGRTVLYVNYVTPTDTGGASVTGFTITTIPATRAAINVSLLSNGSVNVTGLTPGTKYTFTVAAKNSIGTGPASPASAEITTNP